MIAGVGIDAVEVSRMEKWAADDSLLEKYFAESEIADCRAKGKSMAQSLAARFAAKEAFGKALGRGLSGINLKDVRVTVRDDGTACDGAPSLAVSGSAAGFVKDAEKIHISLTHEAGIAIAVVILEN
jgi:holo-[acyl-carrier protein] synthase